MLTLGVSVGLDYSRVSQPKTGESNLLIKQKSDNSIQNTISNTDNPMICWIDNKSTRSESTYLIFHN